MSGFVHINRPRWDGRSITADHCPDCGRRTRFVGFHQAYYGWDETCLRCGRRWQDGEWMDLPFERAARPKSIAAVKALWRRTANVEVIRRVKSS